ncbi:MAG: 3-phosphoshikimate 1-carboxyvinyltransferase [Gemmatimonadota bacterium]
MTVLEVPGDKSISHRALILSVLASGTSRIENLLTGEDCASTAGVLRALGGSIPDLHAGMLEVRGIGLRGLRSPDQTLDCGNSGTTARLLVGVGAGAGVSAVFDGDASLRTRPMRRVTDPLAQMGTQFTELGEPGRLPIQVTGGALREIEYRTPHASAQIKSALLLAGLVGGVHVRVIEAFPSRDHSERMLRAVGVRIEETTDSSGQHTIDLEPREVIFPLAMKIPGDLSSAAFLIAAAVLGVSGELTIRGVGVNPTRTGFLDVVQAMGGNVALENERVEMGEPVADITAAPSSLRGVEIGGALIPRLIDELPLLAVMAARAAGTTTIRDASELRVKESDRLRALAMNLESLGVRVTETADGLSVEGTANQLRGTVQTLLDHRIAMAFGVLAQERGNQILLDDPDVVRISFPQFWSVLQQARA